MQAAQDREIKYSKLLSSLFCSCSIVVLSILSIWNHLAIDLYTMCELLKVVIPASFCFWFLGFIIGIILDRYNVQIVEKAIKIEKQAYEIPSIFAGDLADAEIQEDFGEIWN